MPILMCTIKVPRVDFYTAKDLKIEVEGLGLGCVYAVREKVRVDTLFALYIHAGG